MVFRLQQKRSISCIENKLKHLEFNSLLVVVSPQCSLELKIQLFHGFHTFKEMLNI